MHETNRGHDDLMAFLRRPFIRCEGLGPAVRREGVFGVSRRPMSINERGEDPPTATCSFCNESKCALNDEYNAERPDLRVKPFAPSVPSGLLPIGAS